MGPLYAGTGSLLWFNGWTPTSGGTTFAACLGLFLLALFSRLLGALRRGCDRAWSRRSAELLAIRYGTTLQQAFIVPELRREDTPGEEGEGEKKPSMALASSGVLVPRTHGLSFRSSAPFIAAHDVPRGVLSAFQAFLGFMLMLAGALSCAITQTWT